MPQASKQEMALFQGVGRRARGVHLRVGARPDHWPSHPVWPSTDDHLRKPHASYPAGGLGHRPADPPLG